jgi:PAS domain S-box-containing protein
VSNFTEKWDNQADEPIRDILEPERSNPESKLLKIMEELSSTKDELQKIKKDLEENKEALIAANDSLRQSETIFFNQAPIAGAIVSQDFRFRRVNQRFCQLIGYTEEELTSMSFPDITYPDDLENDLQLTRKLAAGEIDSFHKQKRYVRKDGRLIWAHTSVQIIKNAEGKPLFFLPMIIDITEQKDSEKRLIESEERLRLAFENANEGVCLVDTVGKFIEVNNRMFEIFGYSKDELEDMTVNDITYPEDQYIIQEYIKKSITGEMERAVFEKRYFHKNGEAIWARVSSSLVRDLDGIPLYFIFHIQDITQKKLYEARIGTSFEKLRKAMGGIIQAMSLTVEVRDPYTSGHQRRVADLARAIAQEMGLAQDRVDGIRMSGAIHDIGKISIPSEILTKPIKLSPLEYSLIKNHPGVGYNILKDIDFPWPIAEITLQHHERINGSGYPNGLSGPEMLLEAKILAVADVVEAIASHRPYRPAYEIGVALDEISSNKGILYEPEVVDACLRVFKERKYLFN